MAENFNTMSARSPRPPSRWTWPARSSASTARAWRTWSPGTEALEAANQEIEQRAGELAEQGQQLSQTLHDLESVERERRQLLAQTIRGREDERTWLAAELHDGPIQRLTAVRYGFEEASLALELDDVADSKALLL